MSAHATLSIPAGTKVDAAEAPDGAIFVAAFSQSDPTPTTVWVVEGNGPAAVAETVKGGVAALAADTTSLFVSSDTTVTAFDRKTGTQTGTWTLPSFSTANISDNDVVSMAASGGVLLVTIPLGSGEGVYQIKTSSPVAPQLVAQGSSTAFGLDGSVYYEKATDHDLVARAATGAMTTGPALADSPNGLGGGVQYVTFVAGGYVWVGEPAGQGEDTDFTSYDAKTLQEVGTHTGLVGERIADTAAGPLALSPSQAGVACAGTTTSATNECVFRISSAGTLSEPTPVGSATVLLGPFPAVVTVDAAGTDLEVERLD